VGHLLPPALLLTGWGVGGVLAAPPALAGLYVIGRLWVEAPQRVR
jgi:hypothetical protein